MGAKIEVWVDEDRRIIRQRIEGDLDLEDFGRLEEETETVARELGDPGAVLILVDGRNLGRPALRARARMLRTLERPSLRRIAMFGAGAAGRAMARLLSMMLRVKKLRVFGDEKQAIEWLLS